MKFTNFGGGNFRKFEIFPRKPLDFLLLAGKKSVGFLIFLLLLCGNDLGGGHRGLRT